MRNNIGCNLAMKEPDEVVTKVATGRGPKKAIAIVRSTRRYQRSKGDRKVYYLAHDLIDAIEEFQTARGLKKSEAAAYLLWCGLEAQ